MQTAKQSTKAKPRMTKFNSAKTPDVHHCNCFLIFSKEDEAKFYHGLRSIGAYDQKIQENHGQKWALTYTLEDFWQLHIKMMPDHHIENEIEPRIIFGEHQTIKSKPAHVELKQLLEKFGVNYALMTPTPEPCNHRILNTPSNPTDITKLGIALTFCLVAVVATVLVIYAVKKMK